MGKISQSELDLQLENFIENLENHEIEFALNYLDVFEKQGYDIRYFRKVIKFKKEENYVLNKTKSDLIKNYKMYPN